MHQIYAFLFIVIIQSPSQEGRPYTNTCHYSSQSKATYSLSIKMDYLSLIFRSVIVVLVSIIWRFLVSVTWKPYVITRKFQKQGIYGPKTKFRTGNLEEIKSLKKAADDIELDVNSNDIVPRIFPHLFKWMNLYGGTFLYWAGTSPRICITDAEQVKQVLSNKFGFYSKVKPSKPILALIGRGLVLTDGQEWARHRRVVNPAFTLDKIKLMTKKMVECTLTMLDEWQHAAQNQNSIEVNKQFQELTADVISHAAFGSSYIEGKEVFLAQKELQWLVLSSINQIPFFGSNWLPTSENRKRWNLEHKMKNTLMNIIKSRMNSKDENYGDDLLGIMMQSTYKKEEMRMSVDEIMEECKTFFFAGHETTSHLLTWTMYLLSMNVEWQERLREEVVQECGMQIPNADNLNKLKLLNMVLLEALRLYSPVILTARVAVKDMELGSLQVPKGMVVIIPFAIIHRSKELWGENANDFDPMRFENGTSKAATHPNGLLAFSMGPRACVGQNFAMLEAKIVIAMILQRFSFCIDEEKYKHMPADMLTLQPQNGLPIFLKPLNMSGF